MFKDRFERSTLPPYVISGPRRWRGAKTRFCFGQKTFDKTRYSSHVRFLGKCLRRKVVPSGFRTNFRPGYGISNGLPTRAIISSCSRRLMRMTIASMKQICENLTSQLTVCRTELRSLCDDRLYTDVSLSIHRLNAQCQLSKTRKCKSYKQAESWNSCATNYESCCDG